MGLSRNKSVTDTTDGSSSRTSVSAVILYSSSVHEGHGKWIHLQKSDAGGVAESKASGTASLSVKVTWAKVLKEPIWSAI